MRNWSNVKLLRVVLQRLGLKALKLNRNIAKVGLHVYQTGMQSYNQISIPRR